MIEVTGVAASDRWLCDACGGDADLAPVAVEVGLVRLATDGDDGFRLGSGGIERPLAGLLASCPCGGRLVPGGGDPPAVAARFDADRLLPVAELGWSRLAASAQLSELREVWRPRVL